jgi:hypothetical protein
MTDTTRIVYIGGFGRSGSTLFERALSRVDGFCSVGEVRHIWDRSFAENQLCGCGRPFRECEFWQAVVREAFGGFDQVDTANMVRLKHAVDRTRYIPAMIAGRSGGYHHRFAEYAEVLRRLYGGIRKVSGCRLVIDSSKEPSYGFILRGLADIDLSVIHLVRDSRAVAFSWLKKKERPEIHWKRAFMAQHSPFGSSIHWLAFNALTHGLKRFGCRYLRVYYEDFAHDPAAILRQVLDFLDEPAHSLGFIHGHALTLGVDHTASGNPMRFRTGTVEISPDEEWRTRMEPGDRRLVTACTAPGLLGYGYWQPATERLARRLKPAKSPLPLGGEG